jgi:hypothetical protein
MKKHLVNFVLFCTTIFALNAQTAVNEKFQKAMQTAVTASDSAKNAEQLLAAANTFSRIATAEPKEWLPNYYAAFSNLRAGFETMKTDMSKAQGLIDMAQTQLDKAKSVATQPQNLSEIAVMQAYILIGKVSENPMSKGAELSPKVFEELGKAQAMNAKNPRAFYLQGVYTMNMPEFYGGGMKNAKPFFEKAADIYNSETADAIRPHWGKNHTLSVVKKANEAAGAASNGGK